MKRAACWAAIAVLSGGFLLRTASLAQTAGNGPRGEWRAYGGDLAGTKYSPLDQIAASNVDRLGIAWRWPSPDNQLTGADLRAAQHQVTPLMANGVLYTVTSLGQVAALDPDTGRTRWLFDPEGWRAGLPANMGFTRRGLAYWTDGRAERLILGTPDAYLISVDGRSGKLDASFGRGGRVDLTTGIRDVKRATNYTVNSPPVVARDVVIVGSSIHDFGTTREGPPGDVRGYDVRSGKLLWTFHTVPRKGEPGYETWLDGSAEYTGGTNVWAPMTADEELGYVYLPTSTPTNDWYGGQRGGDNVYAESLVCLDVRTGRRVWHFQAIHHGLWDYDFPAAPILGDIIVEGVAIKAVMQVSKQGFTYVFDRKTGRPVWPIEERPVPQSAVPGERTAPTQPFPTKPVPFERQGVTETEILDFTPELRARGLALLQKFDHGPLFTPPSERGTLVLPGAVGGANWGGAAFDPETQLLYVPSRTNPNVIRVVPGDPARTNMRYRREGLAMPTVDDLPIVKPPYSRVTAIDMSSGSHRWMVPLGEGPRSHPLIKGLNLPALGSNLPGSPLLTKTLLFVSINRVGMMRALPPVGRSEEGPAEGRDERRFMFVFDKATGSLLRQIGLPATSAGAPMTYLHRGAQYIVVAVGIAEGSELVAFRLSPP